ncbi:hypothetical protein Bhyg_05866 [Pseudolycoriella hygida]|uniref:Uncharacterized protein n=1 Tax=Pseudolycoriella hygida TaxID=35572 RepID=A0A9Q0S1W3_9DIPT|nr:hypothetical protein Bhyg_05866 [Pseudolycoriella hygida]
MAFHLRLQLLAAVFASFCVLAHAGTVYLNGFTTSYGLTGCLSDPTKGCGGSDICYYDRGNDYAISGTSPICNACMPKGFRNIATYANPINLPCALWRAYGCDDLFVTHVWYKSGSNSCWLSGRKSYNIKNTFSSASEAEAEFIRKCRQEKSAAFYGLKRNQRITEEQFCFPLRNDISDIKVYGANKRVVAVFTDYRKYYEKKFGKKVRRG